MRGIRRLFSEFKLSARSSEFITHEKQYNAQNYDPLPFVIAKAEGAYVWDVDGKKYLDCIGSFSAMNQGHLHPRIKKAIIEQMDKVTLLGRGVFNDKLGSATEFLCKTFGYQKSILMNTGVEAGETAVKFARRWGYETKGIPHNKANILFANGNFWGRTMAACASSDDPDRFTNFGPFEMGFKLFDYNDAEAFENELKRNPNVAGIMVEPIQGENCVHMPKNGFIEKLRAMCDKYNVLLIIDEVQTGLGRTGKLLCQEHYGVKGDLVTLGKALSGGFFPVSAVLGTEAAFKAIVPGTHGSTFGGNPLAAVTAIESVKTILDEGMVENSAKLGSFIMDRLQAELKDSKYASNFRGKGLFIGFDLNFDHGAKTKYLLLEAASRGLLMKNPKANKVRVAPSLIINKSEANFIADTIIESIKKCSK